MKNLAVLLVMFAFPAWAGVYTWTDENGVTHFGSQPPPATEAEEVEIRESSPGSPIQTSPSVYEMQQRLNEAQHERDQQRMKRVRQRYDRAIKEIEQKRPDYICQGAKNRLKSTEERWEYKKRQGYSVSEQNYYEQRIKDQKRHVQNICR
ncbi:DUF4124 domain-containing protein [Marinobacter bryozoorum]|uniref:DUF4124 domain-containing protein n=1 Tax=Marinobacter bryozoorum TaxID=256324 RepID=UPI0020058532|nr:DUF4124 domain-containing protein [Marinobacter bryozoorum]MCK7542934.1 DUF4124 domain-containing protein [Marinobacter bryozoorum]